VVRRTDVGTFELLGCSGSGVDSDADGYPGGIEPLMDDVLLGYVGEQLRVGFDTLDPTDPLVRDGIGRLREECAAARELLTTAAEASIAVDLPSLVTQVPLTRASFEELVRPLLFTATDALRRTVLAAGLAPGELAAVLLAGDAARTPLVATLVAAALPVRVAAGPHPELRIAKGAALAARYTIDRPVNLPTPRTGEIVEYGDARAVEPVAGRDVYDDHGPRSDQRPRPGHRPRPNYGAAAMRRFGDYDVDGVDPGEPPPRPPVTITPLNLPKRGKRWLRRDSQE
jgi:hypothetical protein